jgi:hypothetical protein
LWIIGFTVISQVVYIILPGQDTNNFYICIGKFPPDESIPVKKNYPVLFLGFFSLAVYAFAWVRIQV